MELIMTIGNVLVINQINKILQQHEVNTIKCIGVMIVSMEEIIQKKLRTIFNDDEIMFDKSRFAGGLTNYNYIMTIHGEEYVIRKPGGMTEQMIDRTVEKINNKITSQLGINSECIYFDEVTGIKIS